MKTKQFSLYFSALALLIIAMVWTSCQGKQKKYIEAQTDGPFNNQFFTLDIENGEVSMDTFKQVFFTNFPHEDPTRGDVVYDHSKWLHDDLFDFVEKDGLYAFLRYRNDKLGYDSYRLTSKTYFNLDEDNQKILFVFKGRFPTANGMWPAWWLNGSNEDQWTYRDVTPSLTDASLEKYSGKGAFHETPTAVNNTDWPAFGEVDIIENINGQKEVYNVIHTCPQMCDSEWNNDGVIVNCANARDGSFNKGCNGKTYDVDSLAGTFACVWAKEEISYYYWAPNQKVREKGGPLSSEPDPGSWEVGPLKNRVKLLETDKKCKEAIHQDWQCSICDGRNKCEFNNLKMIFNVTLCGSWAGDEFDTTSNAWDNCKAFIFGEGIEDIDGQFMKIEYVSAIELP